MEETVLLLIVWFGALVSDHLTTRVWVYFWAPCVVPLVFVSAFLPLPHLLLILFEVRTWRPQLCFSFSRSFVSLRSLEVPNEEIKTF